MIAFCQSFLPSSRQYNQYRRPSEPVRLLEEDGGNPGGHDGSPVGYSESPEGYMESPEGNRETSGGYGERAGEERREVGDSEQEDRVEVRNISVQLHVESREDAADM